MTGKANYLYFEIFSIHRLGWKGLLSFMVSILFTDTVSFSSINVLADCFSSVGYGGEGGHKLIMGFFKIGLIRLSLIKNPILQQLQEGSRIRESLIDCQRRPDILHVI